VTSAQPDGWTPAHDEALIASVDMIGRTGARQLQFGFANDSAETVAEADWWASAYYRGARIMVQHETDALAAVAGLVRKLLQGAYCKCGRVVTLYEHWATVGNKEVLHGRGFWSKQEQVNAGSCRWSRRGARWESSCDADPIPIPGR